jgi:hypothetical protein
MAFALNHLADIFHNGHNIPGGIPPMVIHPKGSATRLEVRIVVELEAPQPGYGVALSSDLDFWVVLGQDSYGPTDR